MASITKFVSKEKLYERRERFFLTAWFYELGKPQRTPAILILEKISDRLWVKKHLDPEEEKLRFSK